MAGDEASVALEVETGLLLEHSYRGKRHRHQSGLSVLGQRQSLGRAVPHDRRQFGIQGRINLGENLPRDREGIREAFAHTDPLASLTRKYKRDRHVRAPKPSCSIGKIAPKNTALSLMSSRGKEATTILRPYSATVRSILAEP